MMAPNPAREQRRVERQRGAATRHIKHGVDFNLVLPGQDDACLELSRASGKPQPHILPAILSIHKTPASTTLANVNDTGSLPTRRSTRRTPTSRPSHTAASVGKRKRGADNASHGKPKNKPAVLQEIEKAIKEEDDLESSVSLLKIDNGSANNTLTEKEVESSAMDKRNESEASVHTGLRQNGRGRSRTASSPEDFNIEYNQTAGKGQGHDMLAPIQPQLVHSHLDATSGDTEMGENPESFTNASHGSPEDAPFGEDPNLDVHGTEDIDQQATEISLTEPKKKRRKKRKAIGQQRPKPKRIPPALNRALPSRPKIEHTKASPATTSQTSESHDGNHQAQPAPSPVPSTKPPPKRAAAPRVPITIFRPSARPSPSTSSPSDPITATLPPQPDTITPIDVLSQITRELISQTSSNTRLSDFSRRTIELYGEELDTRLRTLGETGATCKALEKRVKGLVSEERKVRKVIAEVGRERKKVREEMTRARREGEERSLEALLKGIAGAARRGWEKEGLLARGQSA